MQKALRGALLIVVWLSIGELSLQLVAAAVSTVDRALASPWQHRQLSPVLEDRLLETRGNPDYAGHDERGFRNAGVPARAEIVVLGDSQTYGTSVSRESAWPQQLADQLDVTVYNMGFPGYGPVHYQMLLERALDFEPKLVVVGIYLGNDLYDVFRLAWRNEQLHRLLPADLIPAIEENERREPLESRIERVLFSTRHDEGDENDARRELSWLRQQLSDHSKLYGLARALRRRLLERGTPSVLSEDFEKAVASLSEEQKRVSSVFESGSWKTILTAPYRHVAMDLRDPRIRGGVRATLELLTEMAVTAERSGTQLMVLLIPTKESVFAPRVADLAEHPGLQELLDWESQVRAAWTAGLDVQSIPHLDLVEVLRTASEQPYFSNADGHPNQRGHGIIATEIAQWVRASKGRNQPAGTGAQEPRIGR